MVQAYERNYTVIVRVLPDQHISVDPPKVFSSVYSLFTTVPASPPASVEAFPISPSSVQVVWDEVPAIHRNGILVMYEIEYNKSSSGGDEMNTALVESDVHVWILNVLEDFGSYFIRVRAYTEVGAGPYSSAVEVTEEQNGKIQH